MKCTKGFCALLAAAMLFNLAACGKKDTPADSNLLKLGDYELLYKGGSIMEDSEGNDALVLTLDFTNNSDDSGSYVWSVSETAMQNGTELAVATVFTDDDSFETVIDSQFTDVAPGERLELCTAFVLSDTTNKVEVTFEEAFGDKSGKITVDPSALSRETAVSSEAQSGETDKTQSAETNKAESAEMNKAQSADAGDTLLDWWNGDWYGWWQMTGCSGYYEDMEGSWWDICGTIDIGADGMGTVRLWDEEYTKSDPMADASVSLDEAGTGEHGTMMSEGGWFTDIDLEHADWIVDPGVKTSGMMERENIICIDGWYENGDDEYHYEIYLRPWGLLWDDAGEDFLPQNYHDWYLPMIEAGEPMPDSIG